jgi:outer membrane protein assembly factor BamB
VFGGIAIANGLMFFTSLDGVIHALRTEDGKELWKEKLFEDMDELTSAAGVTVADGMVYASAGWAWLPLTDPPPGGVVAFGLPEEK